LPYLAALALAIFGVAYSNFSGHAINGYWEFSKLRLWKVSRVGHGQSNLRWSAKLFTPRRLRVYPQ
jgi:hypothetical protein